MDTANLKLKRRTWFARVRIPPKLQTLLGKGELLRTLGTHDLREANRRKHAVLAELHRQIAQAELSAALPKESADYFMHVARDLREAVVNGEAPEEGAEVALDVALENHLELLRRRHGADPATGDPLISDSHEHALRLAHRVFKGEDVALLSDSVKKYLTEVQARIRKQTHREKQRHLDALATWLKVDCEVTAITKKQAGKYVSDSLMQQGHAPKTIKDILSNLSAFWVWLESRGLVELNPWRGMSSTVKASTRGTAPKRRPWTDAELLQLLKAIPEGDPLLPLTGIAVYTGMRRDEVANLRAEDVQNDALIVREGKSRAALRSVPIHPVLKPMIDSLMQQSDGYLIPGLLGGGSDDKRGWLVGKRFGVMIRAAGFSDSALVFHTLRNAFIQRCEEAGVPESTTKLLVGHSRRKSLTYGDAGAGYSPGVQLEGLRREVLKVTFGAPVDDLMRNLGCDVKVTKKSRARPRARKVAVS